MIRWKTKKYNKVPLRERKRRTARYVSSTPPAVLSGGGVLHPWLGVPYPWLGGLPQPGRWYPILGYLSQDCGTHLVRTEVPPLEGTWDQSLGYPWKGYGYPTPGLDVLHPWPGGYPIPIGMPARTGVPLSRTVAPFWPGLGYPWPGLWHPLGQDWGTPRRNLRPVTGVPPGKDIEPVEVLCDGDGVPLRGVNWQTNWNYYFPYPSDAGGKNKQNLDW